MKSNSIEFLEYSRTVGRATWVDDNEAEQMTRALMIMERQRRIYDRLAEFERQAQALASAEIEKG